MATLASSTLAGVGRAETTDQAEIAGLQTRLSQLEAREDARYVLGAIEQARQALRTATDPAEDPAAASRARSIARAALALAGRQLERHQSQLELLAAKRRLDDARDRAQAQRRVLEALLQERASLARAAEEP